IFYAFFFSSRRRHTRFSRDWSSDVCSSDLWRAWRYLISLSMKKHTIRIVGGEYRRTRIPVPDIDGLRPTPDRVRETLFSWLHHRSEERRVGKECRFRWWGCH